MNKPSLEELFPIAEILGISKEEILSETKPLYEAFVKHNIIGRNFHSDGHVIKFINDFPNVRPILKLWFLVCLFRMSYEQNKIR